MKKQLLPLILAGCAGVFAAALLFVYYPTCSRFFPICPTAKYLHFYCPGCGSTRAVYCLLHGNWYGALRNNFLLFPTLLVGVLCIFPRFRRHWLLIDIYVVILILFTILRNVPYYPFTLLAPIGIE